MLQKLRHLLRRPQAPRRALPPDWDIQLADIGGEICDPKARRFIIAAKPTPQRAYAHAAAHIFLNHPEQHGDFTEQDCTDADDQASLWLDELDPSVFHDLPARDGEPTLTGMAG